MDGRAHRQARQPRARRGGAEHRGVQDRHGLPVLPRDDDRRRRRHRRGDGQGGRGPRRRPAAARVAGQGRVTLPAKGAAAEAAAARPPPRPRRPRSQLDARRGRAGRGGRSPTAAERRGRPRRQDRDCRTRRTGKGTRHRRRQAPAARRAPPLRRRAHRTAEAPAEPARPKPRQGPRHRRQAPAARRARRAGRTSSRKLHRGGTAAAATRRATAPTPVKGLGLAPGASGQARRPRRGPLSRSHSRRTGSGSPLPPSSQLHPRRQAEPAARDRQVKGLGIAPSARRRRAPRNPLRHQLQPADASRNRSCPASRTGDPRRRMASPPSRTEPAKHRRSTVKGLGIAPGVRRPRQALTPVPPNHWTTMGR